MKSFLTFFFTGVFVICVLFINKGSCYKGNFSDKVQEEITGIEKGERLENFDVLPAEVIKNLPPDINAQVSYFIYYYTKKDIRTLKKWFKNAEPFLPYFKVIFESLGIPDDLVYLSLIESGCSPFAISRAGAVGIWQFMKGTAKKYGLKINYWVDERKDFIKSTYAAGKYLLDLYKLFGDWRPAIASYNLGEGRLLRIFRWKNFADYWQVVNAGLLPYETAVYLPQWMAITLLAKNPQKYGAPVLKEKPFQYEVIKVPGGMDLKVFAILGNIDYDILLKLNAELRREVTPPGKPYYLKVPYGKGKEILKNLNKVKLVVITKWLKRKPYYLATLPYLVSDLKRRLYLK